MKEKLLQFLSWYDCVEEHPEVAFFSLSAARRNWGKGNAKQKTWVALAVLILFSVKLFQWVVYLVTLPMAFINEWARKLMD